MIVSLASEDSLCSQQGQCHHGTTHGDSAPIHPQGYHNEVGCRLIVKMSVLLRGPVIAISIWLPGCGQHLQCHMADLQ